MLLRLQYRSLPECNFEAPDWKQRTCWLRLVKCHPLNGDALLWFPFAGLSSRFGRALVKTKVLLASFGNSKIPDPHSVARQQLIGASELDSVVNSQSGLGETGTCFVLGTSTFSSPFLVASHRQQRRGCAISLETRVPLCRRTQRTNRSHSPCPATYQATPDRGYHRER
jgi:hypothetical protein